MSEEYDLIADKYKAIKNNDGYVVLDNIFYNIINEVHGLNILDIGCGEGHSTRKLKEMGCSNILGVDISSEMINLAKQSEQNESLGINYLCKDALKLGQVGSFDLITLSLVLHYSKNEQELRTISKNIYNNLKSNSRAVILNDAGIKENLNHDFTN